jgi:hypothetical protein
MDPKTPLTAERIAFVALGSLMLLALVALSFWLVAGLRMWVG